MQKFTVLKLIGLALLAMITLVIISILEVTVYSYVVNPGQPPTIYEAHAEFSAPFVSGIFGFILFFLVARRWRLRNLPNAFPLAILFPTTYVALDVLILSLATDVQWSSFASTFFLANGAKYLGSYLGYKLIKIGR